MHCRSLLLGGCRDGLRILSRLACDVLHALHGGEHILLCLIHNTDGIRGKTDALTQFVKVVGNRAECLARGSDNGSSLLDILIPLPYCRDGIGGILLDETNEIGDVLRRFPRLLREFANLLRDNGESTTCLTGACRLNGSVEGKEIRLLGDPRDGIDDRTDLIRAFSKCFDKPCRSADLLGNALDSGNGIIYLFLPIRRTLLPILRELVDAVRLRGELGHLIRHLVGIGGETVDHIRLFCRALCERGGVLRNVRNGFECLLCARCQLL